MKIVLLIIGGLPAPLLNVLHFELQRGMWRELQVHKSPCQETNLGEPRPVVAIHLANHPAS